MMYQKAIPLLQETIVRKLMYGEINDFEEVRSLQAISLIDSLPNVVVLIEVPEEAHLTKRELISFFKEWLGNQIGPMYFVPFRNYIALAFCLPSSFNDIMEWVELGKRIKEGISFINNSHGLQLKVGIGRKCESSIELHQSYLEARKALRYKSAKDEFIVYYGQIHKGGPLQSGLEYIASHYHEDLTIGKVADYVHLSHTYFSRLFKKEMGISFIEYVTKVRIDQAKWLLVSTEHTIEEIANQVGFKTPNYFSAIFKKMTKLTPREYRDKFIRSSQVV